MTAILGTVGQSVFDLTLQSYTTQDRLIKFCTDNNISDINSITPNTLYNYDEKLVQNQDIQGYIYATDANTFRVFGDEFTMEFG